MDTRVEFLPATKAQCRQIAELYSISSDGVADYIWMTLAAPGEEILDVGTRRYQREESVFSYRNCTVAMADGRVIGMLVAFPMSVDPDYEEADPVLAPYSRLEEDDSYYVCGVAVYPQWRGRGIGQRFMALAEQHARERRLDKLSLIVFEQNEGAKRLYDRLGYQVVARESVVPHPLIHHTGDALLMVKVLSQ
jgi:ribosomal protein S18 acetylase RimI-like enzyme